MQMVINARREAIIINQNLKEIEAAPHVVISTLQLSVLQQQETHGLKAL